MYRKDTNKWLKHGDFILLDLLMLQAAYIFSCIARNGWGNPYEDDVYLNIGIIICLADICTVFFMETYSGIMRRGYFLEFKNVLQHMAMIAAMEVSYLFLSKKGAEFSRFSFVVFIVAGVLLLYAERVLWKYYLLKRKKNSGERKKMLVATPGTEIEAVVKQILLQSYHEIEIVGIVLTDREGYEETNIQNIPVVCTMDKIPEYIQTRWIDCVLIHLTRPTALSERIINTCVEMGVTVHYRLSALEKITGARQIERVAGYEVMTASLRMANPAQLFVKRMMDICGGIVGLLLTGILVILLGPAIYLSSPGPIFFSQTRIGKNGKRFKIYKFRSMYMDAEKRKQELMDKNQMQGLMFKLDADPRIIGSGPDGTRHGLGWFIRKTSLDEFPQFWNVLKGEMSLVGTRPPTVDEWEQYKHYHRARMSIKPGLTGMWQVSGRSDITDFEEVVKLDMTYIEKWNIGLDVKILGKTVKVVMMGSGSR